jgi:hypothetical protein
MQGDDIRPDKRRSRHMSDKSAFRSLTLIAGPSVGTREQRAFSSRWLHEAFAK